MGQTPEADIILRRRSIHRTTNTKETQNMSYYGTNEPPRRDLLSTPSEATPRQPDYGLNRHVVANDAAGALAVKTNGATFEGATGFIQLVPRDGLAISDDIGGTGTPTVKLYEWSAEAEKYVDTGDSWTLTAATVLVDSFAALGRKLMFVVSALGAGESLSIYVSQVEA